MADQQQMRYQENGFQLVVYKDRRSNPYTTCDTCGRAMFQVASILDQWAENFTALTHYHYCKHCDSITQQIIREAKEGTISRRSVFQQPPHELLVELLATARQQNGRNVTVITVNRRWWAPHRYPLYIGEPMSADSDLPLVGVSGKRDDLEDADLPATLPLLRYAPPQKDLRQPFISRRRTPTEVSDTAGGPVALEIPAENNAITEGNDPLPSEIAEP
jgi:L-rhamnose mutarotase